MATQSLNRHLPFVVFPTLSPEYTWKIVAVESNRTISRHKLLENAVEKAERLNVVALAMPEPQFAERIPLSVRSTLGTCNRWYEWPQGHANECSRPAAVTDLETGQSYCVKCYVESVL